MPILSFENFLEVVKLAEGILKDLQDESESDDILSTELDIHKGLLESFKQFYLWADSQTVIREEKQLLQTEAGWWNHRLMIVDGADCDSYEFDLDDFQGHEEMLRVLLAQKHTYMQKLVDEYAKSRGVRL